MDLLREYKKEQDRVKEYWVRENINMNMVFTRVDGSLIDPSAFRKEYKAKLKECGIGSRTIHAMRHTFATRALEAEVPIKVVSSILGHSQIQITMDTYSHVLPTYQLESMEKIEEYKDKYRKGA